MTATAHKTSLQYEIIAWLIFLRNRNINHAIFYVSYVDPDYIQSVNQLKLQGSTDLPNEILLLFQLELAR